MSCGPDRPGLDASPAAPRGALWRGAGLLCAAFTLLQALLAGACWLGLHLYFEARDRAELHAHFESARALLQGVDNTAALAAAPPRLHALLGDEPALAVRLQGGHGQPLYEQRARELPTGLSVHARAAPPLPVERWRAGDSAWRGTAVQMHTRLPGAAPLTLAVGLDISAQDRLMRHLALALAAGLLLGSLAFAALARAVLRRVAG